MGFAEKRSDYWRGRYKISPGRYGTVSDGAGATIRFRTKREAERAAEEMEASVRAGSWRDPSSGRITFGEYSSQWHAALNLAESTMESYRQVIETHLLSPFDEMALADIASTDVATWEKGKLAEGYAPASVKNWRAILHLILADAVDEGRIGQNPAARRRGRGKRSGKSRHRGPEKPITTMTAALLVAERTALLSGRDDEFVAVLLMAYTGMRWGEVVGLETRYVRQGRLRVEWQLYELDTGKLHRCPPKDDSRRNIDLPEWLSGLLDAQMATANANPCSCHGYTYVFSGHGAAKGAVRQQGAKLADVARRAGVSIGTASRVLTRPDEVPESNRAKVLTAIQELGYLRGSAPSAMAAHWRRGGFATWLLQPAATGIYPGRAPHPARPVPLLADPWPGVPARGRNSTGRAEMNWLPIAPGLTPHGFRHTHRTVMEELFTSPKLMDERMGHEDGSVQARYTHITPEMRRRLLEGLDGLWSEALEYRRSLASGSPVNVLHKLLTEKKRGSEGS